MIGDFSISSLSKHANIQISTMLCALTLNDYLLSFHLADVGLVSGQKNSGCYNDTVVLCVLLSQSSRSLVHVRALVTFVTVLAFHMYSLCLPWITTGSLVSFYFSKTCMYVMAKSM